MFWHDIKEMKSWLCHLTDQLINIQNELAKLKYSPAYSMEFEKSTMKEWIKEAIIEIFFSEEEYSPFNNLDDKINKLLEVKKCENNMAISIKIADKFENYMKNIDKLNQMINEFKGCVAIARSVLEERKKLNEHQEKTNCS